jgi:UDP-N-acetylglucosamine acyltransferase
LNTISKKAQIGNNVKIGDYTVVEDNVQIGSNVEIGSNVLIGYGARISDNVKIHHGAVVSSIPQDLKFKGEDSVLLVGEGSIIREYATLNRGTVYSGKTTIGKNCLIMAYAHVAHDCIIGDSVILANSANLGGHVQIDEWAIIGGLSGIHQFCKIGKHSILATHSRVVKDVPPFITAGNYPLKFEGLNLIGLQRRGFTAKQIKLINDVYDIIYKSKFNFGDAVKLVEEKFEHDEIVDNILNFIKSSERGILRN